MIKQAFKPVLAFMICMGLSTPLFGQKPWEKYPSTFFPVTYSQDQETPQPRTSQGIRDVPRSFGFQDPSQAGQDPADPSSDIDIGAEEPDQVVVLNDKFAGWQAAGEGINGDRLSDVLRGNWVMVDSSGKLSGTVGSYEEARLDTMAIFLLNKGRVISSTFANPNGSFEINNVREGAYALIGLSEDAFFAFGLNILRYSERGEDNTPTSINVMAVPNKTTINTDWIQFFAPDVQFRVYGRYLYAEGSEDPAQLLGFEGLSTHYPDNVPATSILSQPVASLPDGRLIGRVHQINSLHGRPVDVRSTKVMLLQNNDVYASTTTDNFGVFEFENVPAGDYAIVAAGMDAMGCIGINVVDDADADVDDPIDFCLVPSETVGWLHQQAVDLAYLRIVSSPRQPLMEDRPPCGRVAQNRQKCHPYLQIDRSIPKFQCGNCLGKGCHMCREVGAELGYLFSDDARRATRRSGKPIGSRFDDYIYQHGERHTGRPNPYAWLEGYQGGYWNGGCNHCGGGGCDQCGGYGGHHYNGGYGYPNNGYQYDGYFNGGQYNGYPYNGYQYNGYQYNGGYGSNSYGSGSDNSIGHGRKFDSLFNRLGKNFFGNSSSSNNCGGY